MKVTFKEDLKRLFPRDAINIVSEYYNFNHFLIVFENGISEIINGKASTEEIDEFVISSYLMKREKLIGLGYEISFFNRIEYYLDDENNLYMYCFNIYKNLNKFYDIHISINKKDAFIQYRVGEKYEILCFT